MSGSTIDGKDATRVAAGLKSTITNPNTSTEAKENAAQRLDAIEGQGQAQAQPDNTRVLAGYKAALSNDRVSPSAKRHAQEVLAAAGVEFEAPAGTAEDEHMKRVLAGYKAAAHNDNVSAEAKAHALEVLREHGETA